jgi:Tfp pilus assembly protein PilN
MIKINLLSEGKRPAAVRKAKAGVPGEDLALWMLLLGAFLGVLVAFGHWWILNGRLQEKNQEVARAQSQVDALQAVIKEVDDFKAKKKNLTDKIQVINELKTNQQGPVRIMDYISRALPELLWLDRMKLNPSTIELEGRAFNPNAVAAFMDNLDKVPEFKEGVLKDMGAQNSAANAVYKFVITFDYSFAPKKIDDATAAPTTGKPGTAPLTAPGTPATPPLPTPPGTAPPGGPPGAITPPAAGRPPTAGAAKTSAPIPASPTAPATSAR